MSTLDPDDPHDQLRLYQAVTNRVLNAQALVDAGDVELYDLAVVLVRMVDEEGEERVVPMAVVWTDANTWYNLYAGTLVSDLLTLASLPGFPALLEGGLTLSVAKKQLSGKRWCYTVHAKLPR